MIPINCRLSHKMVQVKGSQSLGWWTEDRPYRHLHLELEHNNNDYLTDNYHCTACGELVAANTRNPFQVV